MQSGLVHECGIDLDEPVIVRMTVLVEQDFDRAEALVEGVEELARVFLGVRRVQSILQALHRPRCELSGRALIILRTGASHSFARSAQRFVANKLAKAGPKAGDS